ncbi:unnamed protein product, partial [Tuber aestivum]
DEQPGKVKTRPGLESGNRRCEQAGAADVTAFFVLMPMAEGKKPSAPGFGAILVLGGRKYHTLRIYRETIPGCRAQAIAILQSCE